MIEQSVSLASNGVVKVPGYEQLVRFGYTKNRGVYRLAVTASGEWAGLTIRCFWHVPDGKDPVSSLVADGYVDVPAGVTAQPGSGCVTFEGSDGTKTVTSADLRYRVSANSGTEDGTMPEPGTPAWQQLVDAVHTVATAAEQAKTDAQTAAQQAGASAKEAGKSLSDTITAKTDALKAIGDKQTSATTAVESAQVKALDAVTDAQNTATQAVQAEQASATTAVKKAGAEVIASIPEDYQTTVQKVKELDAQKVETDETISAVKARQNILTGSETGNPISVDDAFPAPLYGLTVYGKSTQDGTPTPDAPVPIVSAGDGGTIAVKVTGKNLLQGVYRVLSPSEVIEGGVRIVNSTGGNSRLVFFTAELKKGVQYAVSYKEKIVQGADIGVSAYLPDIGQYVGKTFIPKQDTGTFGIYLNQEEIGTVEVTDIQLELGTTATAYSPYREQILTLPTPTGLPGIPVTSGGTYTDSTGQQWICDEVDLERGVKVQRVDKTAFDSTKTLTEQNAILATPIETPLTPAETTTYKALTTYGPDTVVQVGDGAGVKLDYQRDVNLVVKNLEDAIASMTTT